MNIYYETKTNFEFDLWTQRGEFWNVRLFQLYEARYNNAFNMFGRDNICGRSWFISNLLRTLGMPDDCNLTSASQ